MEAAPRQLSSTDARTPTQSAPIMDFTNEGFYFAENDATKSTVRLNLSGKNKIKDHLDQSVENLLRDKKYEEARSKLEREMPPPSLLSETQEREENNAGHFESDKGNPDEGANANSVGAILKEGQIFASFDEFEHVKSVYQRENFFYFATLASREYKGETGEDSNPNFPYEFKSLKCSHGGRPRVRSKNIRTGQQYNAKGCPVRLTLKLFKGSDGLHYKITKFVSHHLNHVLNEDNFMQEARSRRLTDGEAQKFIGDFLLDLKAKPGKIRSTIYKQTGKRLRPIDICNAKYKFKGYESEIEETLKVLENLKKADPLAYVKVDCGEDSEDEGDALTVKSIFVQPSSSLVLFQKYGELILIDCTYNLTTHEWVVLTICIVDNFPDTKLIAFALLEHEATDSLEAVIRLFQEANPNSQMIIRYCMLDKSIPEITALFEVYPFCTFLLCSWHVIQAVKRHVNGLPMSRDGWDLKEKIISLFYDMLYMPTEERYDEKWNEICNLHTDNAGDSDELLHCLDYLENNWHRHRKHWAFFNLKHEQLRGCFTNNRTESLNSKIKKKIQRQSSVPDTLRELLELMMDQSLLRKYNIGKADNKTFAPTQLRDSYENEIVLSCQGLVDSSMTKQVLLQYKRSKLLKKGEVDLSPGAMKCTRLSPEGNVRPCFIFQNQGLPCRHILLSRCYNKEDLILPDFFLKENLLSKDDDSENAIPVKQSKLDTPLTGKHSILRKRHAEAAPIVKRVGDLCKNLSGKAREEAISNLKAFEKAYNRGKTCSVDVLSDDESEGLEKKQYVSTPEGFNLKITQKVKSHCSNSGLTRTSSKKRSKKKLDFPAPPAAASVSQPQWQLDMNGEYRRRYGLRPWSYEEFNVLIGNYQGWLGDEHMNNMQCLIKSKFPHITGLNDVMLYGTSPLPPVDMKEPFIQALFDLPNRHWAVVSNIGYENRPDTVQLYDSLTKFNQGTKDQTTISDPVVWQACQLLYNGEGDYGRVITIEVVPVQQQYNGWDCGCFCLMNMLALAFGIIPTDIVFTGDFRSDLLKVFRSGEATMIPHEKRTRALDTYFMREAMCQMPQNVVLEKMSCSFMIICFCGMPGSFDTVVTCNACQRKFHEKCHLTKNLSKKINFFCYACRVPDVYDHHTLVKKKPHLDDITKCAVAIRSAPEHVLRTCLGVVMHFQDKEYPSTLAQYRVVEEIFSHYNLNNIAHRRGEIYAAFVDYYDRNRANIKNNHVVDREKLTLPQMVQLVFMLVCQVTKTKCPPIWPTAKSLEPKLITVPDDTLEDVINLKIDVLAEIEKQFSDAENRIDNIQISLTNFDEVHEIFEDVKRLSLNADNFIDELDSVQNNEEKPQLKKVKKELTERVLNILEGTDTAMKKCQNYEQILKGNIETRQRPENLRQTPKKKNIHSPS